MYTEGGRRVRPRAWSHVAARARNRLELFTAHFELQAKARPPNRTEAFAHRWR